MAIVESMELVPSSLWCVVATLIASPNPVSTEHAAQGGTKHFKSGAKLYVIDWAKGETQSVVVIGHHRKSRQFLKTIIRADWLEEVHLEEVNIATVAALVRKHVDSGGSPPTKEHARAVLSALAGHQAEWEPLG